MPLSNLIRNSGRIFLSTAAVAIIAGCGEQTASPATPTPTSPTEANAGLLTLVLTPGVANFFQADPAGPLPAPDTVIASNAAALIPSTGIQVGTPINIIGPGTQWLTVTTRILGLTASIIGRVNPNNLPLGIYHASVTVWVPGTTNSPMTLHFWYIKGFYFIDNAEATGTVTTTGFWHRSQLLPICNVQQPREAMNCLPAPDEGTWAYWYGQDATGNFLTGGSANAGSLTTAPFSIPAGATQPVLMFRTTWDIEDRSPCSFDWMGVYLVSPSNSETFLGRLNCGPGFVDNKMPTWVTSGADLTAYRGGTWNLRFKFSTNDGNFNNYRGWIVDRIAVAEPGYFTSIGYPNPITFGGCTVLSGPPAVCIREDIGSGMDLTAILGGEVNPPTVRRPQ